MVIHSFSNYIQLVHFNNYIKTKLDPIECSFCCTFLYVLYWPDDGRLAAETCCLSVNWYCTILFLCWYTVLFQTTIHSLTYRYTEGWPLLKKLSTSSLGIGQAWPLVTLAGAVSGISKLQYFWRTEQLPCCDILFSELLLYVLPQYWREERVPELVLLCCVLMASNGQ